ncbi:MAG: ABC transporter permease, partial [Planctomycetes bacterium]|nr:ABC transporter permease [Planctomycetota bacterium]
MLTLIFRRLLAAAPMLIGVSIGAFLLLHVLPGDPARAILGQRATEENVRRFRESEGLNDPLPVQYGRFAGNLARGDLGKSHRSNRDVADELAERVPATIELTVLAMFIATVMGIALGVLAAVRPRTLWDVLCLAYALVGVSTPIFWLGFLVQKGLAGELGIFPFGARLDIAKWPTFESETGFYLIDAVFVYRNAELTLDVLHHLALPAMVLATVPVALIARMTRANMLEVLGQDFIRTARAKGLAPLPVITRHAMRNALIPVVTAIGTQVGYLLGGAVLTETIFGWPGLGTYVIEAIDVLDAKPLQASVMLIAAFFISVNLITDVSYAVIDPRLRQGSSKQSEAVPGVTWAQFAPWALAALPWASLLVVGILRSTKRGDPAAVHAAWIASLVLVGLELGALVLWLVLSGAWRTLLDSVSDAAHHGLRAVGASVRDFLKFVRHHKPALAGALL